MEPVTFADVSEIETVDDFNEWLEKSGIRIVPFQAEKMGLYRVNDFHHAERLMRRAYDPAVSGAETAARKAVLIAMAEEVKYHFAVHGGRTLYVRIPLEAATFTAPTPLSWRPGGDMKDFYTDAHFHGVEKYKIMKAYFRFSASAYLDEHMETEAAA